VRASFFRAVPPSHLPAQQRALDDLRARGIATTTFGELVDDDALWRELEADMEAYVRSAQILVRKLEPKQKGDFLLRRWTTSRRPPVMTR